MTHSVKCRATSAAKYESTSIIFNLTQTNVQITHQSYFFRQVLLPPSSLPSLLCHPWSSTFLLVESRGVLVRLKYQIHHPKYQVHRPNCQIPPWTHGPLHLPFSFLKAEGIWWAALAMVFSFPKPNLLPKVIRGTWSPVCLPTRYLYSLHQVHSEWGEKELRVSSESSVDEVTTNLFLIWLLQELKLPWNLISSTSYIHGSVSRCWQGWIGKGAACGRNTRRGSTPGNQSTPGFPGPLGNQDSWYIR